MLLFTYYILSSAKYPAEPRYPQRNHHTTGSHMASRLLQTHMPEDSKRC